MKCACSRDHPNWPTLKVTPRPSRDPSTGEIPALHHNPGAPTVPRIRVQIQLTSLGDYENAFTHTTMSSSCFLLDRLQLMVPGLGPIHRVHRMLCGTVCAGGTDVLHAVHTRVSRHRQLIQHSMRGVRSRELHCGWPSLLPRLSCRHCRLGPQQQHALQGVQQWHVLCRRRRRMQRLLPRSVFRSRGDALQCMPGRHLQRYRRIYLPRLCIWHLQRER